MEREPGDQLLAVKDLSAKDSEGNILFSNVSFTVNQGEKIAVISQNPIAVSSFFQIIAGNQTAEKGSFEFGQTISLETVKFASGLSLIVIAGELAHEF